VLARYNIQLGVQDVFGVDGRRRLGVRLKELPELTRQSVELELVMFDFVQIQIEEVEKQLDAIVQLNAEADLLKTLPYVGRILSMVLTLEIGRVERFPSAAHLASYSGLVPRVHSSGGHVEGGYMASDEGAEQRTSGADERKTRSRILANCIVCARKRFWKGGTNRPEIRGLDQPLSLLAHVSERSSPSRWVRFAAHNQCALDRSGPFCGPL